MKKLIYLTITIFSSFAMAQNCDVFQIESQNSDSKSTRLGNGFAISEDTVVINDHSLSDSATVTSSVTLRQGHSTFQGQVLKRDFHTDLAIIKVSQKSLNACKLGTITNTNLTIRGYDKNDSTISFIPAIVKTLESKKMTVPGVFHSLEVVAGGNSELRKSQSGSVLENNGHVVGLITQKTSEGTALAISSKDLNLITKQMLNNQLPKRNYEVDRKNKKIYFDGLLLELDNKNKSGIGGVSPHEGRTTPISLDDYDLGAVLVVLHDISILQVKQPALAKALREAQTKRIFISSIDGIKISNQLDLLRVLGSCSSCKIDNFWVEIQDPAQVQDPTLKLMGALSLLILELEKSNQPVKVQKVVNSIQTFNPLLAKRLQAAEKSQDDIQSKMIIQKRWNNVEDELSSLWHSERTLDLLTTIRELMINQ